MTFDPDPNRVIPLVIAGAVNALKSAYASPDVKRFVFTSSSAAAVASSPDIPAVTVTEDTWNEHVVKMAWADPPYEPERGGFVYAASKTQGEQAIWEYVRENASRRPDLVVTTGRFHHLWLNACVNICTVLPNMNFGRPLDVAHQGYPSSSGMIASLWNGAIQPLHHVLVRRTSSLICVDSQ